MEQLISIIVPIYNVEKYVEKCIESIISQTYKNLEIILVDDGSPDNSGVICDEYAQKDSRIKVIHKENGGLSSARNVGLDIASGEYISFIDSDDYISPRFVEIMYEVSQKYNLEIVQCSFTRNEAEISNDECGDGEYDIEILSGEQALERLNNIKYYETYVIACNKLYKTKIYKNLRFPFGKVNEDAFTAYLAFDRCSKIAILSDKMYYYRIYPSSIMQKPFSIKRYDALIACENEANYFKKNKRKILYESTLVIYQHILKNLYISTFRYIKENRKQNLQMLLKKIRENMKNYLKYNNDSFNEKIKHITFYCFPRIYSSLMIYVVDNIKKKGD